MPKKETSLTVNSKLYPLEVVYSAAYVMLDKAYITLDGDPAGTILVKIKPKNKSAGVEKIKAEFQDELINYGVYRIQSLQNAALRQAILQRALLTNGFEAASDESGVKDPKGIAVPWEEKYGRKQNKNK